MGSISSIDSTTTAPAAAPSNAGSPLPTPARGARAWVPIRSLGPRQRDRIATHLLALSENDRYLRFGYAATDNQIARYVDTLDFERDELFGIFNRKLELLALAHLAYAPASAVMPQRQGGRQAMAEFGVSVLAQARGRGYGARLFDHSVLHARNRGMGSLFIHALSENTVMLKIARKAGATVERDGAETEAWLKLPPDTLATHLDEIIGEQAAEFDYQIKAQAQRVNEFFQAVSDVKSEVKRSAHVVPE